MALTVFMKQKNIFYLRTHKCHSLFYVFPFPHQCVLGVIYNNILDHMTPVYIYIMNCSFGIGTLRKHCVLTQL